MSGTSRRRPGRPPLGSGRGRWLRRLAMAAGLGAASIAAPASLVPAGLLSPPFAGLVLGLATGLGAGSRALAVEPDEILDDPALEARARALSKKLRCLVCRNESIDESNADLARDLRIVLRERLKAGDSDEQAVAYLVDRYGEYVLLEPRADGANLILWGAAPVGVLVALLGAGLYVRRRSRRRGLGEPPLSEAERERLRRILGD